MKHLHQLLLSVTVIFAFVFSCSNQIEPKKPVPNYVNKLKDSADFKLMSGTPLHEYFSQAVTVKLIYDIRSKQIYYIQSDLYKYHFDFCLNQLHYPYDLSYFNMTNYGYSPEKRYMLAVLNYYTNIKQYGLEFVVEDGFSDTQLNILYQKILNTSFIPKSHLYILSNAEFTEKIKNKTTFKFNWLSPETIYASETYQPMVKGKITAKLLYAPNLKKIKNPLLVEDKLILTQGTPLQIPQCKGFITTQMQSPLSHPMVFCSQKNIVSAAIKNLDSMSKLDGQWVTMTVSAQKYSLNLASEKEIQIAKNRKPKYQKLTQLHPDLKYTQFELERNAIYAMGNKAKGLYFLQNIQIRNSTYFQIPRNLHVIPFYYYHEHIQDTTIQNLLYTATQQTIDQNENFISTLKLIRKKIISKKLNTDVVNYFQNLCVQAKKSKLRFRSSSNIEDAENFSGAGMYESYSGYYNPQKSQKSIEDAIKKVWASFFSTEAWMARRYANIAEEGAMMGILVHDVFDAETANGVAITENIYRHNYPGYTISAQFGETSVVLPDSNISCEHLIIYSNNAFTFGKKVAESQMITRSSLRNGAPVLNTIQIQKLSKTLEILQQEWFSTSYAGMGKYGAYSLDIEFKFYQNYLWIKQIRPYKKA